MICLICLFCRSPVRIIKRFSASDPRIANLLKQQGFDSKIVREIHRFVIGYKQSNASSSDARVARFAALEDISRACRSILTPNGRG